MMDVDHFKRVNDDFGHEAGDDALREVGAVVCSVLRVTDAGVRWGGEEILILTESGLAGAMILASRLQEKTRVHVIVGGKPVTASFGVAEWVSGPSWSRMLAEADRALYVAKKAGRDCVRAADPNRSR